MKQFRAAVAAMDVDAMLASLADEVVFQSPIVYRPYRGKAEVGALLRAVASVFRDFQYKDELHSERQTALEFTAKVGDKEVQGIDLGQVNADGLVTHLTVFVRPLSGALALAEAMKAALSGR